MAVIAIFSGSFCQADSIAQNIAQKLSYNYFTSDELLADTAKKHNIPIDKLVRILYGPTPFLNRLTHEKEHYIAYLKSTLAETIQKNNQVFHGFETLLLPNNISHILRIGIIADHNYRVNIAAKLKNISEKDANNIVRKDDNIRFQWSQYLMGLSPWDEELYDIIIPMHSSSVDEAVNIIFENTQKEAVKTTPESEKAIADFVLASRINVALTEKNHEVEILCDDGNTVILINKHVNRLEHKKSELRKIVETVKGVKKVDVKVGPKYHIPSVYPPDDFEVPRKVLLVDDEKDFVHALSERLQTRNFESAVVYDGEEALSFVEGDEPEVIVLDLKMPGIDGIEVLRQVKQNHPRTEVIILTGHGSEKEENLAAELGAFAYFQKPVDIDKLSEAMKKAYKKIRDSKST
ncbi:MAG: response regulator [candidate division Zixibacteria bacterium]|nr:response regulator [candidate division Zixibacteria bacterium]